MQPRAHRTERDALQALPPAERKVLFSRELDNFRTLCGPARRSDALEDRCRERAGFLLDFPECDARCRALVQPHLPGPTR
jgi:cytochrome b pre-mRNA-processing protein 3